jgi:hypothetical protein
VTLAATALAAPAPAAAAEQVTVKPRQGDVNTRFVYRGSGWKPNARVAMSHGALCGTGPCILPLYVRVFRSDADGKFRVSERPTRYVPFDFEGYDVCFSYARSADPPVGGHCKASVPIGLSPPSASVTPTRAERNDTYPSPVTMTLAAEHFKAGSRLRIRIRYPGGHHRVIEALARRHGGRVGPANAWAPRGGIVRLFKLRPKDPDGTYGVRVVDRRGNEARTSFVASHYAN